MATRQSFRLMHGCHSGDDLIGFVTYRVARCQRWDVVQQTRCDMVRGVIGELRASRRDTGFFIDPRFETEIARKESNELALSYWPRAEYIDRLINSISRDA